MSEESEEGDVGMNALLLAKVAVNSEIGYCMKTTSKGLNYSYASEAELIAALRPAMTHVGLTIAPISMELVSRSEYKTKHGATMVVSIVRSKYRLSHVSGVYEDYEVFGEGADVGDKGLPKAMTCALKYCLRQAFLIETGDDPDKYVSQEKAPAGNGAKGSGESAETFGRVVAAIRSAGSAADLKRYAQVFQNERNFSAEQIELLNQHVADRSLEIEE